MTHHELLREAGLRVTAGRLAVLDVVSERPHIDAEGVHSALSDTASRLTLQAVHNVLADLSTAALLRRIEPARSAARYELRVGDNHHHVVCTSCGAIADVDCAVGHAPCLTPSNTAGFAIASAEVTFWGLCSACAASTSMTTPTTTTHQPHTEGVTP